MYSKSSISLRIYVSISGNSSSCGAPGACYWLVPFSSWLRLLAFWHWRFNAKASSEIRRWETLADFNCQFQSDIVILPEKHKLYSNKSEHIRMCEQQDFKIQRTNMKRCIINSTILYFLLGYSMENKFRAICGRSYWSDTYDGYEQD